VSTTYVGIAESVCSYLASISSLSLTAGTNLFAGLQPDEPDRCVSVFERPGMKPLMTFTGAPAPTGGTPQPQSLLDRPLIQLRARGPMGSYSATNTLMQQVFGALQGLANQDVPSGGMFFLLFEATGFPLYMGQDTRQRPSFSLNVQTILQNTQRVPA
jgi:hypothetical protein